MNSEDDVTIWLNRLADGDAAAASEIWREYWQRLVTLARAKLVASRRREADEEDVALSAFNSFCQAAQAGRFPDLQDRYDLWKLLVTITTRKAVAQLRREHTQKRGAANVRGESVFEANREAGAGQGLAEALSGPLSPVVAAIAAEQVEVLLGSLSDEYRQTALLKCEGYNQAEIAEKMDCAAVTVRRRLKYIQQAWADQLAADGCA